MDAELYAGYRLAHDSGMSDGEIGLIVLVGFVVGILLVAFLDKCDL